MLVIELPNYGLCFEKSRPKNVGTAFYPYFHCKSIPIATTFCKKFQNNK